MENNINIMVCDDEPVLRNSIMKLLNSEGFYNVITASNGKEAIDALSGGIKVELIITDYQMPVANGLDLCMYIESNNFNIPVILVTGAFSSVPKSILHKLKCLYRYLDKPYDPSMLIRYVRDVISERNDSVGFFLQKK